MLLVSLLFTKCFSVHFVWAFQSTMLVFRNECNITDRSFPGVLRTGDSPRALVLFLFLGRGVGWGGSHTLLPKSSGFKTQAAGQSPREAKLGRSLAQRPDAGDNMKLLCIFCNQSRSLNIPHYLGISSRIVLYIYILHRRSVFWSRASPKEWREDLRRQ